MIDPMKGINPKYFDEVFQRVCENAQEKHQELLLRVEKYTDLQEMYIRNREELPNSYNTGSYLAELKNAKYWLNKHIEDNSAYII